jgi:hypothetical protein
MNRGIADRIAALEQRKLKKIERARTAQDSPSPPWQPRLKRARLKPLLNWKPATPAQARVADEKAAKSGHRSKSTDALHRRAPGSFENGRHR